MGKYRVYSSRVKDRARQLRKEGLSFREIGLKMKVPKGTVGNWVRDVELTRAQRLWLKKREIAGSLKGRAAIAKLTKKKIEEWKEDIRNKVENFGRLPFEDKKMGKLACAMLYLCEGSKYPARRCLTFGNSDPEVIRLFLKLLRDNFSVDETKFRCQIMHRWDQDLNELSHFWSKVTEIPLRQFHKSKPDERTKGRPTERSDYKGVCSISYYDTSLQYELQAIGEAIMKKGGAGGSRTLIG